MRARSGATAPSRRSPATGWSTSSAIIGQKGFADYFLVVHDIVQHGPTHCGRGSVANSIVSYALGITHVDPLGSGLLFERFLNPERKDPPDIDLDFPWDERDGVLAWVFRRYPHPRAAMVANHNCFRLRGALREVAKVHGRPAGRNPRGHPPLSLVHGGGPLADVLATHPNFQGLDLPKVWQDLARLAQPLVGVPRHLSLHPGGVVIVPTALTDYVPVEPAAKVLDGNPDLTVPVIQFEKDGAEDAGLVKIDLLGNRSLAVIRDAIAEVRVNTGRQIDYTSNDPDDDEPTKALFRTGQTMGVFYTESPASRLLCAKSRADTFELLVLNTSIIRPASNRFIRIYLERLHGAPYEPLDPSLRDTLAETFGVMVYQEDVVNVCATFAGMPLATGDGLRKALSKKRPVKQLAAYAEEFFAGAAALGRSMETAANGVAHGDVVRRLQLLQGALVFVHPGGAALLLPPGPLPGRVHGRRARQRRRVLSSVRLRRRGDADGTHHAAAGREREPVPHQRAGAGGAGWVAVHQGLSAEGVERIENARWNGGTGERENGPSRRGERANARDGQNGTA